MAQQKLKITISKSGEVSMQVEGIAGPSCLGATKPFESALGGQIVEQTNTAEFYAAAETDALKVER